MHRFLRSVVPPFLREWRLRLLGRVTRYQDFTGTWTEAKEKSRGYGERNILEQVKRAARSVASGEARYERDSVLFQDTNLPFALVSTLLRAAARNNGHLQVVDFGGSLGSTFWQCRPFFDCCKSIEWQIVEQPEFVALGKAEFETGELTFIQDESELKPVSAESTVILSSVLQYMESPAQVLERISAINARHLIIDRTTISEEVADRLCIQHVPRHIYEASYPCWILSHTKLLALLSDQWRVISDFNCPEGCVHTDRGVRFEYRGIILEKP